MTMDDLRDRAAKAALDAACYWDDAPDGIGSTGVTWDTANDLWRDNGYRIADAVLAVLRDAGCLSPAMTAEGLAVVLADEDGSDICAPWDEQNDDNRAYYRGYARRVLRRLAGEGT